MTLQSDQDFATTTALYWQTDLAFWTRYNQRSRAAYGQQKVSQHLHVAINHRPHQAEY